MANAALTRTLSQWCNNLVRGKWRGSIFMRPFIQFWYLKIPLVLMANAIIIRNLYMWCSNLVRKEVKVMRSFWEGDLALFILNHITSETSISYHPQILVSYWIKISVFQNLTIHEMYIVFLFWNVKNPFLFLKKNYDNLFNQNCIIIFTIRKNLILKYS